MSVASVPSRSAISGVPLPAHDHPDVAEAPRRISILGATGSVGESTLDLIRRSPGAFKVVALTANGNAIKLAALAREFDAEIAALADGSGYAALVDALAGSNVIPAAGADGLKDAAARPADWTMAAIVGMAGLAPTLTAMQSASTIALANKECLVSAGSVFTRAVDATGTTLIPVDSEHSAAFQAIDASGPENIEKITLTASGGPFREWPIEEIARATRAQALAHPKWSMGPKISIDSATLMNKGLELIEAWHLFPVGIEQLDVIVHPQSIVHCLVAYRDGSVIAHMGAPDMRTPIAYSLAWPRRMEAPVPRLDLVEVAQLDFERPDPTRFPCLEIARSALCRGEAACTVLNAANEVAVGQFLKGDTTIDQIALSVEKTLEMAENAGLLTELTDLDAVYALDGEARALAQALL